jgi:hypothetical protein
MRFMVLLGPFSIKPTCGAPNVKGTGLISYEQRSGRPVRDAAIIARHFSAGIIQEDDSESRRDG